jgi:lipopolysaccharide export LptBFGC system permease protein LptF
MSGFSFWAMHAAIVLGGAVALVAFAVVFGRWLAPKAEDAATTPAAQPEPA